MTIAGYIVGSTLAIIGAVLLVPWLFLAGMGIDCYFFLSSIKNT